MQKVFEHLDRRIDTYEKLPLYTYLSDSRIAPEERLAFAPAIAHFVMSFSDLYAFALREEPARDRFQEIVNAHTYEDGGHWKWFLADLGQLGLDPSVRLSEALRFVWDDATIQQRMLTYHMFRLSLRASSLERLILVHCIEATGKVSLGSASTAGRELAQRTRRKLVYLGPHHVETESQHTLEEDAVRHSLNGVVLEDAVRAKLCALVDETFDAFTAFAEELFAWIRARGADRKGGADADADKVTIDQSG
ncbi:hypothetical protein LZC95_32490 [Pendulispora brunnea]|uniref:Heme oxygenase-like protein n=1 Tax=Pendulispora brunnea TaxID=2905690 RepID=A0ABZ2K1U7_9BACT